MKKLLFALILVCTSGTLFAQSKVAHVNSQKLVDTLAMRDVAEQKLDKFIADGKAEIAEMQAVVEKMYNDYVANQKNMIPLERQIAEEKINKKDQELQQRQQSFQMEVQAMSEQLNAPILDLVQKAIKNVAERMKIAYVIDESVMLYSAGGIDITNEVAAELLKLEKEAAATPAVPQD